MSWGMDHADGHEHSGARRNTERPRRSIETRGESLRIRVYAGPDPVTGKPVYLCETVRGTDELPAAPRARR